MPLCSVWMKRPPFKPYRLDPVLPLSPGRAERHGFLTECPVRARLCHETRMRLETKFLRLRTPVALAVPAITSGTDGGATRFRRTGLPGVRLDPGLWTARSRSH